VLIDIPDRVRWPEVLARLAELGISNGEVARRIGVEKTAISLLKTGVRKQPRFDNGVAILKLYVKVHQRKLEAE